MRAASWGLVALLLMCGQSVDAASLRVSPVLVDLQAPRSSATLQLRNDAPRPLDAQIRIFKWTQKDGVDQYEPTSAVVVSPPATRMAPNVDYTVRVVRISKAPLVGEESYRILVDEVPTNLVRRSGTVNFVMRHAIPVFFRSKETAPPKVSWTLARDGGKMKLVAVNTGGTRLRLSNLSLTQGSALAYQRNGLVGYVLAGAKAEWPVALRKHAPGASLELKAESQFGPVNGIVPLVGR